MRKAEDKAKKVGRWEGEKVEAGRQREEGEKVRRWEGEKVEVGSGNAEVGNGNVEVGMLVSTEANQYPIPNTQYRTPIIAMTAHAMAGDEAKSIEAGMNDHVTKPIDPDQLFATLRKWIKPQPAAERAAVPKQQVIDAPVESDQAMPAADELPESLPGFDMAAGLSRLRGNKRLYRKLLLDFGTKYTETAKEVREALDANDFEQAHSLVHNLKGLAGNLEATELQVAAVEMETLVKGGQKEAPSKNQLDQKFMELEKAINQALNAVQTLGLPSEEKIKEPFADWRTVIPEDQQKEISNRIKAAAEMGDVIQIQSIADELKSANDEIAPFCDELVRLAEDFDFDGIQKFLLQLESSK